MKAFILRNTKTGWEGGVTEKIYIDRLRSKKSDYIDPRIHKSNDEVSEVIADPEVQDLTGGAWTVVTRSPGWFDVVRDDETANEKGLRKAAAEALADKLNA